MPTYTTTRYVAKGVLTTVVPDLEFDFNTAFPGEIVDYEVSAYNKTDGQEALNLASMTVESENVKRGIQVPPQSGGGDEYEILAAISRSRRMMLPGLSYFKGTIIKIKLRLEDYATADKEYVVMVVAVCREIVGD